MHCRPTDGRVASVLLTLRKCGLSAERIKREKRGKEREGERALSALANVPAAADDADDDGDAECESSSLLKKH